MVQPRQGRQFGKEFIQVKRNKAPDGVTRPINTFSVTPAGA